MKLFQLSSCWEPGGCSSARNGSCSGRSERQESYSFLSKSNVGISSVSFDSDSVNFAKADIRALSVPIVVSIVSSFLHSHRKWLSAVAQITCWSNQNDPLLYSYFRSNGACVPGFQSPGLIIPDDAFFGEM